MTKNKPQTAAAESLRDRAEKKAGPDPPKQQEALPFGQAQEVFHDLRVHQIELEMQNEELCGVQTALEVSRERYFDLYDLAPVGYFTLSKEGLILEANLTAAKLFGVKRGGLVRRPLTHFILIADEDIYCEHSKRLFETGMPQVFDLRLVKQDGTQFWARLEATEARGGDDTSVCRAVVSDITDRKLAEEALQQAYNDTEQKVQSRTLELQTTLASLHRANRALLMLKECDEALIRAKNEVTLLNEICRIIVEIGEAQMAWVGFAENDAAKTVRPMTQVGGDKEFLKILQVSWADVPRGRGPVGTAIRSRKVDQCLDLAANPRFAPWRQAAMQRGYGSVIALPLVWDNQCFGALTIFSPKVKGFNKEEVKLLEQLATDLTFGIFALRTRAEREQLQGELLRISERAKQIASQELHDGLCQNLAGTAFLSSLLHSRLAARKEPDAELAEEICDLLRTAINETRTLSHGLHPVGPEGEGLMNTLAQLAETVRNLFHIQCTFRCPEPVVVENDKVSEQLFHITQEAVDNARKHGDAERVTISLRNTPGGLTLTIRDNGVGIPGEMSNQGLEIMNYRAAEIGATLSVHRADKSGTLVTCRLVFG